MVIAVTEARDACRPVSTRPPARRRGPVGRRRTRGRGQPDGPDVSRRPGGHRRLRLPSDSAPRRPVMAAPGPARSVVRGPPLATVVEPHQRAPGPRRTRVVDRSSAPAGRSRNLVLAAMIFAVSMTFIDQTIVSIAIPKIQHELGLTSTGAQWVINSYLLTLAALFAFGGRLADIVGHRRMVVLGIVVFAGSSVLCGLTPTGSAAEGWIVAFRALQGAGGAIMFPAALAIVVATFPLRDRGKALALFFGIASGLTAVGPVLGGVLTEWTWRAIFWVNVPVALVALALAAVSKPESEHRPAPIDYRGLVLIAGGVGLSVFGFQQASIWGWHNPAIGACIAAGAVLLVVFTRMELRTEAPLIEMRIFSIRPFLVENLVLGVAMLSFIPLFFIASEYAQISLGKSSSNAGIYLLYFFIGFAVASQIGGRRLDRAGAKRPVVLGCVLAAVGYALWAGKATQLSIGAQEWYVVLAGGGMGLMLGPASTD